MSKVGNKLKTLIGEYIDSTRPANFYFATMKSPTAIQLDSSQGVIPESQCIIPEHLRSFSVLIDGTPSTIDNSLKTGDKVVVLQKPGGQKYLILGRI